MLNTYDKFTLFQYFGQRPFSRKNMHFSINLINTTEQNLAFKAVEGLHQDQWQLSCHQSLC